MTGLVLCAGWAGLGQAASTLDLIYHPSIAPLVMAVWVFASNLVQLQSNTKEMAEWLVGVSQHCCHDL